MLQSKRTQRYAWIAATAIGLSAFLGATPAAAAYPDKSVRIIVTFPPAGATDILARIVAQKLTEESGQTFVVENRAGAGGNVGMEAILRSAPDGYTIGMIITSHAINMSMPNKPNYDVTKDLVPLVNLTLSNNVLVVHPSVPANTVQELVDLSKSGKMSLNFASPGNGTTPHLSGELFKQMTGAKMSHVPYKGAGPAMNDLIGGTVQIMFDAITTAAPQIEANRVRPLGVTGIKRSPVLPNIPTISEAGVPGYQIDGWIGMIAPAGTPPEIVDWLGKNITKVVETQEIQDKIKEMGLVYADMGPDKFKDFIAAEVKKWEAIIKKSEATND